MGPTATGGPRKGGLMRRDTSRKGKTVVKALHGQRFHLPHYWRRNWEGLRGRWDRRASEAAGRESLIDSSKAAVGLRAERASEEAGRT